MSLEAEIGPGDFRAGRRGLTLLELMVVVAIVGLMASMAVAGYSQMVALGRVNGAAGALTRMLSGARIRGVTQTCKTSVQINGAGYAPTGTPVGFPNAPLTVTTYMKSTCAPAAPNGFFEAGDRVLSSFSYADDHVDLSFPAGITTAGTLGAESVVLSWDRDGSMKVYHATGATFAEVAGVTSLDIVVSTSGSSAARHAIVPFMGTPYVGG